MRRPAQASWRVALSRRKRFSFIKTSTPSSERRVPPPGWNVTGTPGGVQSGDEAGGGSPALMEETQ